MHRGHQVRSFIHHWLHAENGHSIHEPFAFELYQSVIRKNRRSTGITEIEDKRAQFKNDTSIQEFESLGATSSFRKRSLRDIAYHGGASPKQANILHDLVSYTDATYVVELGTSVGMTSLYLAQNPNAKIFTHEGDSVLLKKARKVFQGQENVSLIEGNIDTTLPQTIAEIPRVDFAYLDANHQYEPTLRYFEQCLSKVHDESVLVLDDIHWSKGMSDAWNQIRNHERVTLTMDFHQMGWVFFRPTRQKYHYILSLN